MNKFKKGASSLYLALIFLFLYAPILVLIVLSFNDSMSRTVWGGFTLKWYANLSSNDNIMEALGTTIKITLTSSIFATILGTTAAIGIHYMKKRHTAIMLGATNIPLLNADIVTGISLMLLFTRFTPLGEFSVILAHIAFSVPYVIFNVLPRLQSLSEACFEAATDLGATPMYAFYKVVWPEIFPGVLSGFLMALTMSLDDFTITYFTKGAGVNTLSTMLYTQLRKGIQPELYALSTILFLLAFALLLVINFKGSARKEVVKNEK
ncbi:MAG: ABC transporter permease [Pseudobutyrivibrio sp.]|nr:ABC transporter permease [Pseudobutyrivibrio sp.]